MLRLHYVGANLTPQVTGQDQLPGTVNYLLGADPAAWTTNVPTYGRVIYQGLYPGIDLAYYGNGSQLEDDFTVAPGADPSQIAFTISGTLGLSLDAAGNLLLATAAGTVEEQAPVAYQVIDGQRQDVPVQYTLSASGQVDFSLGSYDPSQPLIIDPVLSYIDPVLSYSTYLGGSGDDYAYGITTDTSGNVYVTGGAVNTNFPQGLAPSVTVTATSCGEGQDVFVTKLHPASGGAAALVYTTFIGGTQNASWGQAIRLDPSGYPDVSGYTCADDYPTKNPYQGSLGGSGAINALFTQLSTDGTQLRYSSYLGGSYQDEGYGLAVDGSGHAYLTGATISSAFPTKNALQKTFGGGGNTCNGTLPCNDAFVAGDRPRSERQRLATLQQLSGRQRQRRGREDRPRQQRQRLCGRIDRIERLSDHGGRLRPQLRRRFVQHGAAGLRRRLRDQAECRRHGRQLEHLPGRQRRRRCL